MKKPETLMRSVVRALNFLKEKIGPRVLAIVCDGISPLEKMNEMRARRRKPRTNLRQNITFGTVIFNQILAEIEQNFPESCHFDQHGEGETKIYRLLSEVKETSKISIYSNDSDMINLAMLADTAGIFSRFCKVC